MNIQRIRRQRLADNWEQCDFCDEDMTTGFSFTGRHDDDNVSGPRGRHLSVCDKCLERTKKSSIGFWNQPRANLEEKKAQ